MGKVSQKVGKVVLNQMNHGIWLDKMAIWRGWMEKHSS